MRSETFGRLLKVGIGSIATGEGKTQPAIEDELGQQSGVTGASIQRYKAGHLPPELRTIEILVIFPWRSRRASSTSESAARC